MNQYTTAIVTEPYYYYYHSLPYFESMYITQHDITYPPKVNHVLVLDDDTRIERFGSKKSSLFIILLFLIIITIIILLSKKI
ncbi:hypothetical protein Indivirus_4_5 [Indivirus ILV1]|uniref:Uncharacterized protein n=1 Tax=Indivirus ILV1 TaxID=1977633 RepID=A0A1V0SDN4_9VIRU|nr:hypothetical protein Indivirus_4_5 [Indivirus ILV1]